jgi:hypothetical protein
MCVGIDSLKITLEYDLERRPSIGRKPGDQYQMANFHHHPHRQSPTRPNTSHTHSPAVAAENFYSNGQKYRAYNTPANLSDEEEAVSTNAPMFTYNPAQQVKQRRLPSIGIERGYSLENQNQTDYSPRYGNRPYAPPSPSPRSPTQYVEHPGTHFLQGFSKLFSLCGRALWI